MTKRKTSGKQFLVQKLAKKYGVTRGAEIYKEIGLPKGYKPTRKRAKEIFREATG